TARDRPRAEQRQQIHERPMRRRLVAVEEAGRTEQQRARAHRRHPARARALVRHKAEHLAIGHERELPRAAGDEEHVERRAAGEHARRRDRQPRVGAHRVGRLPQKMDLGAGHAVQHLERAGQVELRQPRIQEHPDVRRHAYRLGPPPLAGMAKMIHFLPMALPRVILVAFAGAQGLDVFGPAEAFAAVARAVGTPAYDVVLAASRAGTLRATSGIALGARALGRLRPRPSDTVIVVGGDAPAIRAAVHDAALVGWIARAAPRVRRIGSVCSGAFVLANAGVLDGRRAATHWAACDELARYRPAAAVDRDAIFVRDGCVWTSAGVTTGIDMALAMIEEDHDRRVADTVAARLVLYARRPGFQSQFSDALVAQRAASDPLGPLVAWARANLRGPLDVERLARRAGLSVR